MFAHFGKKPYLCKRNKRYKPTNTKDYENKFNYTGIGNLRKTCNGAQA